MKKIWLVRHAQSQAQAGKDSENFDSALSNLGRKQAKRLIKPLKNIKFDCILLSPLKRAWQTYKLSQVKADIVQFDSRLREAGWEGRPPTLPDRVALPNIAKPDQHSDAWLRSGEECSRELLSYLLEKSENNILLFGHYMAFANFFRVFADINPSKQPVIALMNNAAISLLEIHETRGPTILYWNDRSHVIDILDVAQLSHTV